MSALLAIAAWYVLIGLVPPLLATFVDDFWERVMEGAQYEDPARHEVMVQAFNEGHNLLYIVTSWPLILMMAIRLYRVRGRIQEIRQDCDVKDAMVKAIQGGVLARDLEHPTDCMLCRVEPRACKTLAVFHCGSVVDEGKAIILDQVAGTFLSSKVVSRRGDKYFIYGEVEETPSESIMRHTLTNMVLGMPEEEAIRLAVLNFVKGVKG